MNKKQIFLIGSICTALLGLIAVLMPLAPYVSGTLTAVGQSQTTLRKGFDFIFGEGSNGPSVTAWIFVLVGIILAVCGLVIYLLKKEKVGGLVLSCGGLFLLVGSILYFFFVQFAGLESGNIEGILGVNYSLAFGAWIGGIIGAIGGAVGIGIGVRELLAK